MASPTHLNGIDLTELHELIDDLRASPASASCHLQAHADWLGGSQVHTTLALHRPLVLHRPRLAEASPSRAAGVAAFSLAELGGESGSRRQPPEPIVGVGSLALLLHAIARGLAGALASAAAVRNVRLEALSLELHSDLDLRELLGLTRPAPPPAIAIRCRIKAACDRRELGAICRDARRRATVLSSLTRTVRLSLDFDLQGS